MVLTLHQRLQSPPCVPFPITSPGRSAGAGGELSGQKRSLVPPRRSSTTLPKLEELARASVCRPDLPLTYSLPLTGTPSQQGPVDLSSIGHVLMWARVTRWASTVPAAAPLNGGGKG